LRAGTYHDIILGLCDCSARILILFCFRFFTLVGIEIVIAIVGYVIYRMNGGRLGYASL